MVRILQLVLINFKTRKMRSAKNWLILGMSLIALSILLKVVVAGIECKVEKEEIEIKEKQLKQKEKENRIEQKILKFDDELGLSTCYYFNNNLIDCEFDEINYVIKHPEVKKIRYKEAKSKLDEILFIDKLKSE
jgi:hypothetical protein